MKKVLITGGKGFFGSRFVEAHCERFDILAPGSLEMNILQKKTVEETFSRFRPDYVIHAAARPLTGYCNDNPEMCYEVNVKGTEYIAEACKARDSKMIFISTEQVFNGNSESGPFSERDTPCPDTVYGRNKLEAENRVRELVKDSVILRLTWLFGVPEDNRPVSNNILWETYSAVRNNELLTPSIYEYRGLTFVDELIERFPLLMDLAPGLYHTGSANDSSRYETVRYILMELGMEKEMDELLKADKKTYKDSPRDVRLNTGKLQKAGICFSDSRTALRNCIEKYGLKLNTP